MDKLKGALKSRTMAFSLLLIVFGYAEANLPQLQGLIPPKWYGPIFFGVGAVSALLRWVTTLPLEEK